MLELNFICFMAIACLISLTSLDTTDALPLEGNPIAHHIEDMRKDRDDMQALPSYQNWSQIQKKSALVKTKSKDNGLHLHSGLSTKAIEFIAQGTPRFKDVDGRNSLANLKIKRDDEGGNPSDSSDSNGGSDTTKGSHDPGSGDIGTNTGGGGKPSQITISLPKFAKDHMGDWKNHLWGATYGNVWGDTRFNKGRFTIPRIRIDSNAPNNYYPDGPRSTVCLGSTIYNVPKVTNWLKRNVYTEEHKHRPFWDNLRMQLFIQGKSEECHDATKFEKWKDYQECAVRRNQRLEYMIPKYPLQQIGYRGRPTRSSPRN